jgi:hypothetical protein
MAGRVERESTAQKYGTQREKQIQASLGITGLSRGAFDWPVSGVVVVRAVRKQVARRFAKAQEGNTRRAALSPRRHV